MCLPFIWNMEKFHKHTHTHTERSQISFWMAALVILSATRWHLPLMMCTSKSRSVRKWSSSLFFFLFQISGAHNFRSVNLWYNSMSHTVIQLLKHETFSHRLRDSASVWKDVWGLIQRLENKAVWPTSQHTHMHKHSSIRPVIEQEWWRGSQIIQHWVITSHFPFILG